MNKDVRNALGLIAGYIVLWYVGAMLNFFPFGAVGFTGLLLCIVFVICTGRIMDEIRKSGAHSSIGTGEIKIRKMRQSEALEIADRWKYDGEYAFYDMTADPEDYAEITSPELRGDRYFSVFDNGVLIGFFCVDQGELGLGLRPDLTGQGRGSAFLAEILDFVRENYKLEKLRLSVASFNQRAVKTYKRAGAVETGFAEVPTNGGIYEFTLMELKL